MNCLKKILLSVFFLSIFFFLPGKGFSQSPVQIPQPPVDIEFTAPNSLQASQEAAITINVTPKEDIFISVKCFIPDGVEITDKKTIAIIPYIAENILPPSQQEEYAFSAHLWTGPLKAGITKKITVPVRFIRPGSYKFLCRVNNSSGRSKDDVFVAVVN